MYFKIMVKYILIYLNCTTPALLFLGKAASPPRRSEYWSLDGDLPHCSLLQLSERP